MISHAQCGEDVWILENLKPPVGAFCEVGAFDGCMSSNTLLFEEQGWTGVLVEPVPELAGQSRINRKATTICCSVGLWDMVEFSINPSDLGLSGCGRPGNRVPVPQCSLHNILRFTKLENLNLLSIDTEGTEIEVWNSIGDIRPRIVIMEYQTCGEPPQDKAIIERMALDGYQEVHRTQYNLIFTLK